MSLSLRTLRSLTRLTTLNGNDIIHVYSPTTGKDHYVLLADLLLVAGGYPEWNSDDAAAGDYDTNDQVTFGFKLWKSLVDNNTAVPTEGANWTEVSPTVIVPTLPSNLIVECGGHNASTNLFPTTGGTGSGGSVKRGNMFYVTVSGTLNGEVVPVGTTLLALVDTPGQTAANWIIKQ